jgi:hypothetical protein
VRTALALFGDRLGGDQGRLLGAIRGAGPNGLNTAGQHAAFNRHLSAEALAVLREQLVSQRQVVVVDVPTGGRPAQHAVAIAPSERTTEANERQRGTG